MTVQELDALRDCRKRIATAAEAVERIRDELTSITSVISDMPKGGGHADRMAALVARIADIQTEQAAIIVEREDMLIRAEDWMYSSLPEQQQIFFRLFYIRGMSMRQAAESAPYSLRHCKRINAAIRKRCH